MRNEGLLHMAQSGSRDNRSAVAADPELPPPSRLEFAASPLTLGTVQLGVPYGFVRPTILPSEMEAFEILNKAVDEGITTIDTARAYGSAEARIGRWLVERPDARVSIITKVSKLPQTTADARQKELRTSIDTSRRLLGLDRLPLVLVHEERDLLDPYVVDELQNLTAQGQIVQFGASVYTPEIAMRLLTAVPLAALQLPASVVDHRFERAGVVAAAAAQGVAVFVRSVFLQGILLGRLDQIPPFLGALADVVEELGAIASAHGISMAELALLFMRDNLAVASMVLGIESSDQLQPHLEALRCRALPRDLFDLVRDKCANLDDAIVDPSRWRSISASP